MFPFIIFYVVPAFSVTTLVTLLARYSVPKNKHKGYYPCVVGAGVVLSLVPAVNVIAAVVLSIMVLREAFE